VIDTIVLFAFHHVLPSAGSALLLAIGVWLTDRFGGKEDR
jgi:hypothetical protein